MLALKWRSDIQIFDLVDDGDGFLEEDTLKTSEIYSIHTDRRARDRKGVERRGYWASRFWGSTLWTQIGFPLTNQRLEIIESDMRRCMRWMIDDGIVSTIEIEYQRRGQAKADFDLILRRDDGQVERYSEIWENTVTDGGC